MSLQALPEMTDGEFRLFAEMLRGYCGLHFGEESRFILEQRVRRRMAELAIPSYAAYHYELNAEDARSELGNLIDEVTTNETYFFRERRQLRTLFEEIIPQLQAERSGYGRGPLSVWSAGCSSGEEPYTLVMMAMEAGLEPGRDLHVYASDISRTMLQKARRGVYREASFRETRDSHRGRFFVEKNGLYRIRDEIKRHVDFIHLNLMDRSKIALLGTMDVLMCRNVLIYFRAESKRQVIDTFYQKLRPGGYLLLGHSESLMNLSSAFELRHLKHDLVYRRPGLGEAPRDLWHAAAAAAIAQADEPTSRS